MPAKSSFLIHLFLVVALVSVTHSVNSHVRDHDDTHFFSFSPSPPFGLFSCFVFVLFFFSFLKAFESNEVFVAFCARSFASQWTLIAVKTRKRAISCSSVHILFNSSSAFQRPSGDAIGWMKPVFLWFIFLLSFIYLFHCEELYGGLNFAGLHSMRGRWYCLVEREDISLRLLLNQM